MMNHFDSQSCERLGPLISAKIDGELDLAASLQLDQHLEMCTECRQRIQVFSQITDGVYAASSLGERIVKLPEIPHKKPLSSRLSKRNSRLGTTLMRWVPLATAASVLIGLIVVALPSGPTVTAEQIATPLAELELINDEQNQNQARMLKTLEFELRLLKLELNSVAVAPDSENGAREERIRIEVTLNRLIEKVKQFGDSATNQDLLF